MQKKTMTIIGAGFAGLSAGIYAQMNGYQSEIFEMHNLPGGLCTAWKRKGYTIDGCIHWLVGSSPESAMNQFWREVGLTKGREFVNLDEYMRYEGKDGRTVVFYTDVKILEKHLLQLSPRDEKVIRELISGIRLGIHFDQQPTEKDSGLTKFIKGIKMGWLFLTKGKDMRRWMDTTAAQFAQRFQDPLLREAINELWFPEFSVFFIMFTFSYLNNKNAGYPIGGSMPLSRALEKRYLDLGGVIHYGSKVEKILVENDQAVGIELQDGVQHRADRVVSAADGHTTIFKMLDGKYVDEKVKQPYEKWPLFPPLIYVGLGINRVFDEEPKTVSGISFCLNQPVEIGDQTLDRLTAHIFNQDPTLAPAGKTAITVMINSNYQYWKDMAKDPVEYEEKKGQIARQVVSALEQRFPGIESQVEMVDVATPLTFERYTGNWQGSFEGWLITPQNASSIMSPMKQTLPGLMNFYLCGQWVEPGGGLPTGVMSGRRLMKSICKEDGKKFVTTQA